MKRKKTYKPLPIRLKLILTLAYLACISAILMSISALYDNGRGFSIEFIYSPWPRVVASLLYVVLLVWVIYNFHKRKRITALSYVISELVYYGVLSELLRDNSMWDSWTILLFQSVVTGISIVIVTFLLRSKEAATHLNK